MHLEFTDQPLVQVSAKFTLRKELPVCLPFAVDLHGALKSRLPDVADLLQPEVNSGQTTRLTFQQLNGAVYSGSESPCIFILQRDLILVRWMKEIEQKYPSFSEGLMPAMEFATEAIRTLVGHDGLQPRHAIMEYVTFVGSDQPLTGRNVEELVGPLTMPIAAERSNLVSSSVVWRDAQGVELNVGVTEANQEGEPTGHLLRTAGAKEVPDVASGLVTLIEVHEALCEMFAKIVTDKANKEWNRQW